MALLTTEDVLNKKFQSVKFREGYDQVEVDEFLDEVVATIYALQVENQELKEKLEAAERRVADLSSGAAPQEAPAPVAEPEPEPEPEPEAPAAPAYAAPAVETAAAAPVTGAPGDAASMLALAQRVHDEYVKDGEDKANSIIADARQKGDQIVAEAEAKKSDILAELARERGLLESKVNELRTFESEYRGSLRTHLQGLLEQVQEDGDQN